MAPIRIGCSGWNYRHWRRAFYPDGLPATRWFGHYAGVFATVEINNSFYRVPEASTFAKWRDQAPPGFRYAVKANRFLTHNKKLRDIGEPLADFIGRARALGETLGPILYQLPPRWRFNGDRLREFAAILPRDIMHVLEFREPSWMDPDALALLDALGLAFCTHDMIGMSVPRVATGPLAYVRFHGSGGKYWGRYDDDVLRSWADWIAKEAHGGRQVWAYFNNDIHADAIADALALRRLVKPLDP
ncbi:MAG TPA: DUF72 domain-containing protein [Sphingomonadaceae bacterium]|nr:DUF72 domain-containing protein [Sphingomonadaceae bacterium]